MSKIILDDISGFDICLVTEKNGAINRVKKLLKEVPGIYFDTPQPIPDTSPRVTQYLHLKNPVSIWVSLENEDEATPVEKGDFKKKVLEIVRSSQG